MLSGLLTKHIIIAIPRHVYHTQSLEGYLAIIIILSPFHSMHEKDLSLSLSRSRSLPLPPSSLPYSSLLSSSLYPITEPTVPSLTSSTSTDSGIEPDLPSPLKRWEIVIIAVNIVVVMCLVVIIPLVMACVCTVVWRKRTIKEQQRKVRGMMTASYTRRKRPRSMAEHLQLEESDVESVDFGESRTKSHNVTLTPILISVALAIAVL